MVLSDDECVTRKQQLAEQIEHLENLAKNIENSTKVSKSDKQTLQTIISYVNANRLWYGGEEDNAKYDARTQDLKSFVDHGIFKTRYKDFLEFIQQTRLSLKTSHDRPCGELKSNSWGSEIGGRRGRIKQRKKTNKTMKVGDKRKSQKKNSKKNRQSAKR